MASTFCVIASVLAVVHVRTPTHTHTHTKARADTLATISAYQNSEWGQQQYKQKPTWRCINRSIKNSKWKKKFYLN